VIAALALSALFASVSAAPLSMCAAVTVPIPEDLLAHDAYDTVESYRRMWRGFCSSPRRRPRSLAPLLEAAEALAKNPAVERAATAESDPSCWLPALLVDDETDSLFVHYTAFVEAASSGTAEDRAFLPEYVALAGDVVGDRLPPWIGYVDGSGYATCLKLGEVDWLDVARRVEALRERARSVPYRTRVDRVVGSLVDTLQNLERGIGTCCCNENANVLEGLDALASASRNAGPIVRRLAASAKRASRALRESNVTLVWDRSRDRVGGCTARR